MIRINKDKISTIRHWCTNINVWYSNRCQQVHSTMLDFA